MALSRLATPPVPPAIEPGHLTGRLARLSGARGGKALWAIVCCVLAEGGGPVQWSRRELARRTGFSESGIDEALALGEAAHVLERRAGERAPERGGLTPIVLALVAVGAGAQAPRGGVCAPARPGPALDEHAPSRGVSARAVERANRPARSEDLPPGVPSHARDVDSTPDSNSIQEPGGVESGSDRAMGHLVEELAARASAATGDTAPAMMRDQVARAVARLAAEAWLPSAMAALVEEAIRRSQGQRQPARYCWRVVWQLVEEGWCPAQGLVRRPFGPARRDRAGDDNRHGDGARRPERAPGVPIDGADTDGMAVPALDAEPAGTATVVLATGTRLPVAMLWRAALGDAARAAGAEREVAGWRWRPLVALGEDAFQFQAPPGGQVVARRLHPHLRAALARMLGRPVRLDLGHPAR